MAAGITELVPALIIYGETDVTLFDPYDVDFCPDCDELLDEDGYCPNGCNDDTADDEDEDYYDDLEDVDGLGCTDEEEEQW